MESNEIYDDAPNEPSMRRWLWGIVFTALLVVISIGAVLWKNKVMVADVVFRGHEIVPTEVLQSLADIPRTSLLFALDDDAIIERIEAYPWIERASILKSILGNISITVTEHTPKWRFGEDDNCFLSAQGDLLPLPPEDTDDSDGATGWTVPPEAFVLPVIVPGAGPPEYDCSMSSPERAEVALLLEAINQLDENERPYFATYYRSEGAWWSRSIPTPAGRPLTLALGATPIAANLQAFPTFWSNILTREDLASAIRTVDLRFEGQIIVPRAGEQIRLILEPTSLP